MFQNGQAPRAAKKPHTLHRHGHRRRDPYFWLCEREDPAVLEHLHAENAYAEAVMAGTTDLQTTLGREIRARMADAKVSDPVFERGYWYWHSFDEGSEYARYWRGLTADTAAGELLLDTPALAAGEAYFSIGDFDITPDNAWLAYTFDTEGRRLYRLRLVNLASGDVFEPDVGAISGDIVFADDNKTLLVVVKEAATLREYRVDRLLLAGGAVRERHVVYEETDSAFLLEVGHTKNRDYLTVTSSATLTSEHRLIDARAPHREPQLFAPRQHEHEHAIDYDGATFWILSNLDAPNGRLLRCNEPGTAPADWQVVVPDVDDAQLEDFDLIDGFVALELTRDAQAGIDILRIADNERWSLEFDEAVFSVGLAVTPEYKATAFRVHYESMSRPARIYAYEPQQRRMTERYVEPVRGDFEATNYVSERIDVRTADGADVPVSIVRRATLSTGSTLPVLVYGYGAYGLSMEPYFSVARLSLLDRGFVFAIAHVRGGSERGQAWYEGGRLARKGNSFADFTAVADAIVSYGAGEPNVLYAMGGSAGGLLMGAVMNARPERFVAVVAEVPFVDVVTTMLDETIPLTSFEYGEWGDPRQPADYHTMLAYSPYDNVQRTAYPHVLITTGLHDSQVQYWEPAKWAARLRERNQSDSVVLLKTEMQAGHGGKSGRYERLDEVCFVYAFLLAAESDRKNYA